eukprot:11383763-Prorocentrum_lima.AAC.1
MVPTMTSYKKKKHNQQSKGKHFSNHGLDVKILHQIAVGLQILVILNIEMEVDIYACRLKGQTLYQIG